MGNLAYKDDYDMYEIIGGKKIAMSPRPSVNHNIVAGNIYRIFGNYLEDKSCRAFSDGVDVHFDDENIVIPDVMIVCNKDIIKRKGIYGVPDLMVEVLSPSTAKNDKGSKKTLYEKYGVKEYWIVDTANISVEVYLLKNEKFELEEVYTIYPDYILEDMTDEEKNKVKTEIKVSFYDDFTIKLERIFKNLI